jgi:hypothetical protein
MDLKTYRTRYGSTPAARRQQFRQLADQRARQYPNSPASWQDARRYYGRTLARMPAGNWAPDDRQQRASARYYASTIGALPGRYIGTASDLANDRRMPTGYYADHFQSETLIGHVLQLPARNGAPRYYPAVSWSDCDQVTGYPLDWYGEPAEAARAADHYAERLAEAARDDSARYQAEQDIEEARQLIRDTRDVCRQLIRDTRQLIQTAGELRPSICATLAGQIRRHRQTVREQLQVIRDRSENYWTAVE